MVGLIAGILLGDVTTGIIIGASLEAIFMGAINIGGAISAEPASATVLAVAFTVTSGIDQEAAIALAVPVAVVSAFFSIFMGSVVMNIFAPVLDRVAARGDEKGLYRMQFGTWAFKYFIFASIVFIAVLLGSAPVAALINLIPANVMAGLKACGALLPAVGMSLLMKMLWSKELAVYFFAGFICVSYLHLPMIGVAAIGVILAVVGALRDKEIFDLKKGGTAAASTAGGSSSEEEEFFA